MDCAKSTSDGGIETFLTFVRQATSSTDDEWHFQNAVSLFLILEAVASQDAMKTAQEKYSDEVLPAELWPPLQQALESGRVSLKALKWALYRVIYRCVRSLAAFG